MSARIIRRRLRQRPLQPIPRDLSYTERMVLRFGGYLFLTAFLLNFVWEVTQMPFFAVGGQGQIVDFGLFLKTHWIASLKDAAMVIVLYFLTAVVVRNMQWGRHMGRRGLIPFLIAGFLWAVAVEYYQVQIAHSWSYNATMPLLPFLGVGLWPVLQLIVLPPLAVFLSRRHLFS